MSEDRFRSGVLLVKILCFLSFTLVYFTIAKKNNPPYYLPKAGRIDSGFFVSSDIHLECSRSLIFSIRIC